LHGSKLVNQYFPGCALYQTARFYYKSGISTGLPAFFDKNSRNEVNIPVAIKAKAIGIICPTGLFARISFVLSN
jgi:hypothetical protein